MQIQIGKYELHAHLSKLEQRDGVCSKAFDCSDYHCLLWDFDNADFEHILRSLYKVQVTYHLPEILLCQSSANKYHAYCFAARPFREVVHILTATPEIDMDYLRLGIVRGYFTLRISPRNGEKIKLLMTIISQYPNEMQPFDMTVSKYWTSNRGQFNE